MFYSCGERGKGGLGHRGASGLVGNVQLSLHNHAATRAGLAS